MLSYNVQLVCCAAYYVNLLETGSLRWADNCLVVIDEAHHCLKDHPYSRLIQLCRHSQLPATGRPRLLGLTASPAGRDTLPGTVVMLRQLMTNLAVDNVITVQRNVDELRLYQSIARLDTRLVSYSSSEHQLARLLRQRIAHCYLQLRQLSDVTAFRELDAFGSLSPQNVEDSASDLDSELVRCLVDVVDNLEPKDAGSKPALCILSSHVKILGHALEAVDIGLDCAYNELSILLQSNFMGSFRRAMEAGLKCDGLETLVGGYFEAQDKNDKSAETVDDDPIEATKKSATYVQLTHELESWWDSCGDGGGQSRIALVLVRTRKTADVLSKLLRCSPSLVKRQMSVALVVGHGSGGTDGGVGMTVQQQARTLQNIAQRQYNVIVATSVAEEGVDLPQCDLVIELEAPDCVRALVQVRGRARKPDSQFVVFLRDAAQKAQLHSLLVQEQHMTDAVRQIINSSNLNPNIASDSVPKD